MMILLFRNGPNEGSILVLCMELSCEYKAGLQRCSCGTNDHPVQNALTNLDSDKATQKDPDWEQEAQKKDLERFVFVWLHNIHSLAPLLNKNKTRKMQFWMAASIRVSNARSVQALDPSSRDHWDKRLKGPR